MDPIIKLMKNIMDEKTEVVYKMCKALGIELNEKERQYSRKDLVRAVFMKWLNAGEVLLEMICTKLPSPKKAQ
jgi:translation elongation factor EF-G